MNDIALAIIGAISGGGIAGLISVLQKRRLVQSQASKLYAEAFSIANKTLTEALEALRNDYNQLAQEGEKLKKEIEKLKREQGRLRRAIEKISSCTSKDTCPVAKELQNDSNNK